MLLVASILVASTHSAVIASTEAAPCLLPCIFLPTPRLPPTYIEATITSP